MDLQNWTRKIVHFFISIVYCFFIQQCGLNFVKLNWKHRLPTLSSFQYFKIYLNIGFLFQNQHFNRNIIAKFNENIKLIKYF